MTELSLAFDLLGSSGAYTRYYTIAAAGLLENSTYNGQSISMGGLTFVHLPSTLDYSISPVSRSVSGVINVTNLLTSSIGRAPLTQSDLLQRIRFEGNHTTGCGIISVVPLLSQAPNVTLQNGASPLCLIATPPSIPIKFDLLLTTVPVLPDYINMTMEVPCNALNQTFLDFN